MGSGVSVNRGLEADGARMPVKSHFSHQRVISRYKEAKALFVFIYKQNFFSQ